MRDDDRPPVLAHERFKADRDVLAGLPLTERFKHIHETNMWGADTSVSGLGSEDGATATLRATLPNLLEHLDVSTLLDAPCGDAGWIGRAALAGIRYIGVDIVPSLIAMLRAERAEFGDYAVADITSDPLPRADAILCRDCLVHLSFANIGRAVENFRRSGARWLLTTTFPDWQMNNDCEDGDWRALNFERPPFAWGTPHALLTEECREAGGGWADKSLGVWRLDELPAMPATKDHGRGPLSVRRAHSKLSSATVRQRLLRYQ